MKRRICIVQSTYNNHITYPMIEIAAKELRINKINSFKVLKVPGSFEIPQAMSRIIKKYDGFIAIGCIIKGQTKNFDLISSAITSGIMHLSIQNKKPIGNAIITSFNEKQALKRKNNAKEAAKAVIEVLKNS